MTSEVASDLPEVTVVETLCMACFKNGTTRLMLTQIPKFKEVIIGSFECPHCGYMNRQVQSGAALAEKGCKLTLKVENTSDLNRQVIKSDTATIRVVELDMEIPPETQKGICSTIEGFLREAAVALRANNDILSQIDVQQAERITLFLDRLENLASGRELPFTFVLEDPAGNSFIEPLTPLGTADPQISVLYFERTAEQLRAMGFSVPDEDDADSLPAASQNVQATLKGTNGALNEKDMAVSTKRPGISRAYQIEDQWVPKGLLLAGWDLSQSVEDNISRLGASQSKRGGQAITSLEATCSSDNEMKNEGMSFPIHCPHCAKLGSQNMCQISIPGFGDCMIMAFNCEHCGGRSNEVKPLGAYGTKGRKWTLSVVDQEDLNRDVLKSDTAAISIPELEFDMAPGTLGGVFTTIEGLLVKITDNLSSCCSMFSGDASDPERRVMFQTLLNRLSALTSDSAALPFTLILDDAADLSMISHRNPKHAILNGDDDASQSNGCYDHAEDAFLKVVSYTRSAEQDDDLGISGMKTGETDTEHDEED